MVNIDKTREWLALVEYVADTMAPGALPFDRESRRMCLEVLERVVRDMESEILNEELAKQRA